MNKEYKRREDIIITLKHIFLQLFNIDLDQVDYDYLNENLLGPKIGFMPRDLLYLYFEIEERFNIHIDSDSIVQGKFNNLSNIINIISRNIDNENNSES